jgi:hypothetical protein
MVRMAIFFRERKIRFQDEAIAVLFRSPSFWMCDEVSL